MGKQAQGPKANRFAASAKKTLAMFVRVLPIVVGVVLLSGLIIEFVPADTLSRLFGHNDLLDALIGATAGGISAGHPLTSYLLGGELLANGVSLTAVTALLVSWVTVGSIQLPAEALMLGRRFALYRNLLCFVFAILIGLLTVATLGILGPRARATTTPCFGMLIHPVWLRCENLKDNEYSCVSAPCQTGASTPRIQALIIARALKG